MRLEVAAVLIVLLVLAALFTAACIQGLRSGKARLLVATGQAEDRSASPAFYWIVMAVNAFIAAGTYFVLYTLVT
jgi:hypothetical protein